MSNTDNLNTTKASPKRENRRWEIGWYVLFILGPAAFIGPFVALFFALYSATSEYSFFLILGILGIVLYLLIVFILIKTWIQAGNPNSKPAPTSDTFVDILPGTPLNLGIMGIAMLHGLFGGQSKSDSDTAFSDLFWQEKYRRD